MSFQAMASPLRLSGSLLSSLHPAAPFPVPRITRVISLDAMNTLITPRESPPSVYASFAERHGVPCHLPTLETAFYKAMQSNALKHPCFGHNSIGPARWWTNVIVSSVKKASESEPDEAVLFRVAEELFEHFADKAAWKLVDPEVTSVLTHLRQRGFSLAVVSNFDFRLRSLLRQLELAPLFDVIITSGELGIEKPDGKIFEVLLKHFDLSHPSEILHIGDSLRKDYLGAKDFGAKALLFDPLLSEDTVTVENKLIGFKHLNIF